MNNERLRMNTLIAIPKDANDRRKTFNKGVPMKSIVAMSMLVVTAFAVPAQAYQLEKASEESRSTVYVLRCTDGKVHRIRQERSDGKWCYDSSCHASLQALLQNSLSNCK